MGLIRSGNTELTPLSNDCELTNYLWPIVREIIKTAIENQQNLVVEGCYIPFCWREDFSEQYLSNIKYICLVMSEEYIKNNIESILQHASDIEHRIDDSACCCQSLIEDNAFYLDGCKKNRLQFKLIDTVYNIDDLLKGNDEND